MDALARFHGAWWDYPLLDGGAIRLSPWCADPAAYDDLTTSRRQDWERFLEAEGGWSPPTCAPSTSPSWRLRPCSGGAPSPAGASAP